MKTYFILYAILSFIYIVQAEDWENAVTTAASKRDSVFPSKAPLTAPPLNTERRPRHRARRGMCEEAYHDNYEVGDAEEGYLFGALNNSHIRFGSSVRLQLERFNLSVTFRTYDDEGGLILYASESVTNQFLALYMKHAQVHLAYFDPKQSDIKRVVSKAQYNHATKWHTATVVMENGYMKLHVDSEKVEEAFVSWAAPPVLEPIYYGGLSYVTETISQHLEGFYQPFKGCLKSLMINGLLVTDIEERVNSLRCDHSVNCAYFGPSSDADSSYLKVRDNFTIGPYTSISMLVHAHNRTGLLLSIHGRDDFLVVELLKNKVIANGRRGPPFSFHRVTMYEKTWYRITVVKLVGFVGVNVGTSPTQDLAYNEKPSGTWELFGGWESDINSALYIGGHERPISEFQIVRAKHLRSKFAESCSCCSNSVVNFGVKVTLCCYSAAQLQGVRSGRGFNGYIKNIKIVENIMDHEYLLHLPLTVAGRNTKLGVCPSTIE